MNKKMRFSRQDLLSSGLGKLFENLDGKLPKPPMLMMDKIIHISDEGGKADKIKYTGDDRLVLSSFGNNNGIDLIDANGQEISGNSVANHLDFQNVTFTQDQQVIHRAGHEWKPPIGFNLKRCTLLDMMHEEEWMHFATETKRYPRDWAADRWKVAKETTPEKDTDVAREELGCLARNCILKMLLINCPVALVSRRLSFEVEKKALCLLPSPPTLARRQRGIVAGQLGARPVSRVRRPQVRQGVRRARKVHALGQSSRRDIVELFESGLEVGGPGERGHLKEWAR